jgi:hypothetical protein
MKIQELYIQSMLAEAAYADLQTGTPNNLASLQCHRALRIPKWVFCAYPTLLNEITSAPFFNASK